MKLKTKSWEFTILLWLGSICLVVGIFGAGFVLGGMYGQNSEFSELSLAAMGISIAAGLLCLSLYLKGKHDIKVHNKQ